MSLSETNLHPQNVNASYPGCANPTTSSTDEPPAAYSEPNAKLLGKAPLGSEEAASKTIDSAPVIESAEIAPLGEGKLADDATVPAATSGLVAQASDLAAQATSQASELAAQATAQATDLAKQAYTAVVGESK